MSKRLYDRVQQVLAQQSKPVKQGRIKYHFIGLVRCAECGCMITAETQKSHVYYRCTKKRGACSQGYLREEALLAQIRKAITQVSIDTETRDKILQYWQEQTDEASNASASRSREIALRLQHCDEQMERLLDLYIARDHLTRLTSPTSPRTNKPNMPSDHSRSGPRTRRKQSSLREHSIKTDSRHPQSLTGTDLSVPH